MSDNINAENEAALGRPNERLSNLVLEGGRPQRYASIDVLPGEDWRKKIRQEIELIEDRQDDRPRDVVPLQKLLIVASGVVSVVGLVAALISRS